MAPDQLLQGGRAVHVVGDLRTAGEAGDAHTVVRPDAHPGDGAALLVDDAESVKPLRIGGPFHWVIDARRRGPSAWVTAGLDDEIRATLRISGEDFTGEYG